MKKQRVVHFNDAANVGSILVNGLRHHNIESELIKTRLKGGAYSLPVKFLLFSNLDDVAKDADIAMRALAGVRS